MSSDKLTFRQRKYLIEADLDMDQDELADLDLPRPKRMNDEEDPQKEEDILQKTEDALRSIDYIEAADGLLSMAASLAERSLNAIDIAGKDGEIEEIQTKLTTLRRSLLRRLRKFGGSNQDNASKVSGAVDKWRARKIQALGGAMAGQFSINKESLDRIGLTKRQQREIVEAIDSAVSNDIAENATSTGAVTGASTSGGWGSFDPPTKEKWQGDIVRNFDADSNDAKKRKKKRRKKTT